MPKKYKYSDGDCVLRVLKILEKCKYGDGLLHVLKILGTNLYEYCDDKVLWQVL